MGPGNFFDHKIRHEFPYGYYASDAFQHQVRAEAIKDAGNFRYEATYISKGFENVVGRYPPVIYHLAVILSHLSGLETYDSIYFIALFFPIIAVFILYFIISNFNKNVAIISLPFSLLIYSYPINTGLTWGHWPSILSQSFLIGFFWSIARIDIEKSFIFISAFLTGMVMTHTSEAIFAILFLALFFGFRLLTRKLSKEEIKKVVIACVIAFVAAFYYLIIFKGTLARVESYSFLVEPEWNGNPGFYIYGFKFLLIFLVAGIIFSLIALNDIIAGIVFGLLIFYFSFFVYDNALLKSIQPWQLLVLTIFIASISMAILFFFSKMKELHTAFILAYTMLLGGFLNYIGFSLRSFQVRFFWPIYLSVFFGLGLYMLSKLVIRRWNVIFSIAISIVFAFLLSGAFNISFIPQYNYQTSPGIMDKYHWQALTWLSEKTEPNARVYFFYGNMYSQDALLRNSKRIHYEVDPKDFIKAIQERKIKRYYVSKFPGDSGGSFAVRTGLFSFKDASEGKPSEYFFGPQDICKFDYIVFDKPQNDKDLKIYNVIISNSLKKDFVNKVYDDNEVLFIVKNNKTGADCIEERSF